MLCGAMLAPTAFAVDPTNPILFVTQVPMPEEVNTRTITSSYMSCVSPFDSHLGGTASTIPRAVPFLTLRAAKRAIGVQKNAGNTSSVPGV